MGSFITFFQPSYAKCAQPPKKKHGPFHIYADILFVMLLHQNPIQKHKSFNPYIHLGT